MKFNCQEKLLEIQMTLNDKRQNWMKPAKWHQKINIWQMDKIAEGEKKQEKDQIKKM